MKCCLLFSLLQQTQTWTLLLNILLLLLLLNILLLLLLLLLLLNILLLKHLLSRGWSRRILRRLLTFLLLSCFYIPTSFLPDDLFAILSETNNPSGKQSVTATVKIVDQIFVPFHSNRGTRAPDKRRNKKFDIKCSFSLVSLFSLLTWQTVN